MKKAIKLLTFILLFAAFEQANSQDIDGLDDIDLLLEEFPDQAEPTSKEAKLDDFETFKDDVGDIEFILPEDVTPELMRAEKVEDFEKKNSDENASKNQKIANKLKILNGTEGSEEAKIIFDIGAAEKNLLEVAKKMEGKIPNSEWNEIAGKSTSGTYEVVVGDWLWKISKNIFGSGFYYAKIWALNPFITNPHEIEPGMILSFNTGSDNELPSLGLKGLKENKDLVKKTPTALDDYTKWGDDTKPRWITEKERLKRDGVYIQYGTGETKDDLDLIAKQSLIKEFEVYEPPALDFAIGTPGSEYDSDGFDRSSKIKFSFKEGFHLTTFISTNVVQDFGKIESSYEYQGLFTNEDRLFVRFDEGIDAVVGDKFSIYSAEGKTTHPNSDRAGFKYIINGSVELVQKHEQNFWECKVIDTTGTISRGDRVTVYTPKIDAIIQSFNPRIIEAVILSGLYKLQRFASFGDIVYLDRGRADGVEVGNVLEVYGFKDRNTGKNISDNPTYKNGELTVLTVTDNFSTALVSQSTRDFIIGDIAVTKTKAEAARMAKLKNKLKQSDLSRISENVLDELDVELNLDDLNDNLLDKADKIQFTEDELAELERQEREKSIISENEKDLKALERLETDLEAAEKILNEAKLDEDKLLENESLDKIEKNTKIDEQESLDELEENFGKRFLDEDLNDKDNPFGLTEFDIEEVDELLNTQKESL